MTTPTTGAVCPECGLGTIRGHCGPDGRRVRSCSACPIVWMLPSLYARREFVQHVRERDAYVGEHGPNKPSAAPEAKPLAPHSVTCS